MKTYGEKRAETRREIWTTDHAGGWTGQQSRKVARRRVKDKKKLHRRARRTAMYLVGEQNGFAND